MAETKINKNQAGDGIFTSDNLVAGTNISMTQETETIVSGLDEYTQLYIPFNNSLSDLSANNCTVTLAGNPYVTYIDGKFDKALSSITASSGFYVPVKWTKSDSSKFSIENGFTMEYWQYYSSSDQTSYSYFLYFGETTNTTIQYKVDMYDSNGTAILNYQLAGFSGEINNISTYLNDGGWNHIAVVLSPSQYVRIFLNGHQVVEKTGAWTQLANLGNSFEGAWIGSWGSFDEGKIGKYDEFRLSNTIRYTADFTPQTVPFGAVTQRDVTKINNTQDISSKANVSLDNLSSAGKSLAAGLGMPIGTWTGVTIGASGATYTATHDGWLFLRYNVNSAAVGFVSVGQNGHVDQQVYIGAAYSDCYIFTPIKAGSYMITYDNLTFLQANLFHLSGQE